MSLNTAVFVAPSFVINISFLKEKIRKKEKENPDLNHNRDNKNRLNDIIKEIKLTARMNPKNISSLKDD